MARGLITSLIAGLGAPVVGALANRFLIHPYLSEQAQELQRQKMVDNPIAYQQKGFDLVGSLAPGNPVDETTGAPNFQFWNQAMKIPGYEGTKDFQQLASGGAVNALAGPQAEVQRQLGQRYAGENLRLKSLLPGEVKKQGAEIGNINARTGLINTENQWMPQMNQAKLNEIDSSIAKNAELIARSQGPERDKLIAETNQLNAKSNELKQGIKINQVATLLKSLEFNPSPQGQAAQQQLLNFVMERLGNKAKPNVSGGPVTWGNPNITPEMYLNR